MTNQDIFNAETLSEKQLSAIPLIIAARTMTEAAEKTGTSRNTLYEWQKNPAFKAELQRQREMAVEEAMKRLELNVFKAVDILGTFLDHPDVSIFHKRSLSFDMIKHFMKIREQSKLAQVEKRVSELEKELSHRAESQKGGKQG